MRITLFILLGLFSEYEAAFCQSVSITIKPTAGLTGTVSFNLHEDGQTTLLKYTTPGSIEEYLIRLKPEMRSEIIDLAHVVLKEYMGAEQFAQWAENQTSFSVAVTADMVTKSVSTRRYSENASKLREIILEKLKDN